MKYKFLITISILTFGSIGNAQVKSRVTDESYNKNTTGINVGIAALEALLSESGFNVEFFYQKRLNKMFFVGINQGFIIQDNFPTNYYSTNTAPFQLASEVDGYIRSLNWGEAFDFEWKKTTMIYVTPFIGADFLHYKRFSFGVSTGVGVQYRNYTRFGLTSYTTNGEGVIIDYKEKTTINSVIAPVLNISFILSQALTRTLAMQLNFKYNHELSNPGNLKNTGSGDYMALRLGLSKTF